MALSEKVVSTDISRPIAFLEGAGGQLYQKSALVDENGNVAQGSVTPVHLQVDVATSTTPVISANANRRFLRITNDSDAVIYLNLVGAAAVVGRGERINAAGSNLEMSQLLGNLVVGAITAIHGGAGNKSLLVTEGT